jgi:hypothetical protein
MDGIQYVIDGTGKTSAVQIDLSLYGEIWEDFYDNLLINKRINEPRESLGKVKIKL